MQANMHVASQVHTKSNLVRVDMHKRLKIHAFVRWTSMLPMQYSVQGASLRARNVKCMIIVIDLLLELSQP